jgi:hypothetical protein
MAAIMRKAKEAIMLQMEEVTELDIDIVIEIIRPHFFYDAATAREQALRRKANQIMAQFKDEKGIRKCFVYQDKMGTGKYLNIEKTEDLDALDMVKGYLEKKYIGLNASIKKINSRRKEVAGQISIDEYMSNLAK